MLKTLNAKQEKFCQEYRVDFCGTQAAIRAGYAKKAAGQAGYKNLRLPLVQKRIAELVQLDAKRNDVSVDRVLQEYAKLAFSNLHDFLTIDGDEATISLAECTPEQIAALTEYTVETYMEGKGENAQEVKRIKIKLSDKRAALSDLAKHLGMFAKDNTLVVDPSDAMNKWLDRLNSVVKPFGVTAQLEPDKDAGA